MGLPFSLVVLRDDVGVVEYIECSMRALEGMDRFVGGRGS